MELLGQNRPAYEAGEFELGEEPVDVTAVPDERQERLLPGARQDWLEPTCTQDMAQELAGDGIIIDNQYLGSCILR